MPINNAAAARDQTLLIRVAGPQDEDWWRRTVRLAYEAAGARSSPTSFPPSSQTLIGDLRLAPNAPAEPAVALTLVPIRNEEELIQVTAMSTADFRRLGLAFDYPMVGFRYAARDLRFKGRHLYEAMRLPAIDAAAAAGFRVQIGRSAIDSNIWQSMFRLGFGAVPITARSPVFPGRQALTFLPLTSECIEIHRACWVQRQREVGFPEVAWHGAMPRFDLYDAPHDA